MCIIDRILPHINPELLKKDLKRNVTKSIGCIACSRGGKHNLKVGVWLMTVEKVHSGSVEISPGRWNF